MKLGSPPEQHLYGKTYGKKKPCPATLKFRRKLNLAPFPPDKEATAYLKRLRDAHRYQWDVY